MNNLGEVLNHLLEALRKSEVELVGMNYICVKRIRLILKISVKRRKKKYKNCCQTYRTSKRNNVLSQKIRVLNIIVARQIGYQICKHLLCPTIH